MRQMIFISGRGHSGSTLLGLMLSGHPRLVGVGEVYGLFNPARDFLNQPDEVVCSCGKPITLCPFWATVYDSLLSAYTNGEEILTLYKIFLSAFYDYFGPDTIPVDISKTDESLKVIKELRDVDIKVIFLIRDVRSWTVSMRDIARRKKEFEIPDLVARHGWKAWKPFFSRTSVKFFWHWYLLNQRTQNLLREAGLPTIRIGYEELCLYPEFMMNKICTHLDLDYRADMLSLADKESHVILGNRMSNQKHKRRWVAYDTRWFYRLDWMLPAVLFPNIMRYNSLQVYENIRNYLWNT